MILTNKTARMGIAAAAIIVAGLLGFLTCTPERMAFRRRAAVERATRPYNPNWRASTKERHLAIGFNFAHGKLESVPRGAGVKSGRRPYSPSGVGNVTVRYLKASGKVIGHYQMSDPLEVRSCNPQADSFVGGTRLDSGYFEIPVPYDPSIAKIELIRAGDSLSFDVESLVKHALMPSS
jgi:hypothetical protein